MVKIKKIILILVLLMLLMLPISSVSAFTIKSLPGLAVTGDFALSTDKIELALNPGDTTVRNISVTNRTGRDSKFKIEIEDFGPSDRIEELTKLYGDDMGPYSLRRYLVPEISEFTLKQGEQISIVIAISIPYNVPAGGLYGCVLVSNIPSVDLSEADEAQIQNNPNSYLGTLFFVKVNGETIESGRLTSFDPLRSIYTAFPVRLKYTFNNDGNIYLTPKSTIVIKNIFNSIVGEIKTDPFFVLPDSERVVTEEWPNRFMFGRYTATINLDRGYGGNTDIKTISFWVFPDYVILLLVVLVVLIWIMAGPRRAQKQVKKVNKRKVRK